MDDSVQVRVVIDDPGEQRPVRQVAFIEDTTLDERARSRDQGVQDDRFVPGLFER